MDELTTKTNPPFFKDLSTSLKLFLTSRFGGDTLRQEKWWQKYNFSQLCYFLACAILLFQWLWIPEPNIVLPGLIALVGLVRELLGLFHFIWAFSLGKALVLVLYASTANIALAFAAVQINQITGIEPTPFVFTLGFTTVVLLPFWIAVVTMIFFALALVIANFWLLLRLPLKLFGFKVAIHWEDRHSPFITMLMRIVLIPVVFVSTFILATPFFGFTLGDVELESVFENPNSPIIVETESGVRKNVTELTEEERTSAEVEAQVMFQSFGAYRASSNEKADIIRSVIADFIFNFEAYPYSACVKRPEQRSVKIDENMILLISQDESGPHGYHYEVVLCEPRISTTPQ